MSTPLLDNRQLGPDVARANLLTNGGFEQWQRGAGAFSTNNAFTADRWQLWIAGTDTLSVARIAADTTVAGLGQFSAQSVFTLGTGAGQTGLYQTLKVTDGCGLQGLPITLSIWANPTVASGVSAYVSSDGTGTPSAVAPVTARGFVHVTITVPENATAIQCGIRYNASCTAYVDNACLVVGSQAANYVPLHPADDLARCLRYYETPGPGGTGSLISSGVATATQTVYTTWRYFQKAVTPTATKVGTWAVSNAGQPSLTAPDKESVQVSVASLGAGVFYAWNNGAGMYVTLEANP
jgi:hypothetical protein